MRLPAFRTPSNRAVLTTIATLTFGAGLVSGTQAAAVEAADRERRPAETANDAPPLRPDPETDTSPGEAETLPRRNAPTPVEARVAPPVTSTPPARGIRTRSPAPAVRHCSGEGWEQRRGQAALRSLRSQAGSAGFRVEFRPGRDGVLGLTHLQQRRIEIFVRPCDVQSDELLRHVLAHEIGHAYDTTHMTAGRRAAWNRARGIPTTRAWYGCSHCPDFATPAGDFAEVYAQWARGASSNKSRLGGDPARDELDRLAAEFFRR